MVCLALFINILRRLVLGSPLDKSIICLGVGILRDPSWVSEGWGVGWNTEWWTHCFVRHVSQFGWMFGYSRLSEKTVGRCKLPAIWTAKGLVFDMIVSFVTWSLTGVQLIHQLFTQNSWNIRYDWLYSKATANRSVPHHFGQDCTPKILTFGVCLSTFQEE